MMNKAAGFIKTYSLNAKKVGGLAWKQNTIQITLAS